MKILITGAKGFVGQNLTLWLKAKKEHELFLYDIDTERDMLEEYIKQADFLVHLAGVNRPVNPEEFQTGNKGFTEEILSLLDKYDKKISIILSSSIQAMRDNPYGNSKKSAEEAVFEWSKNNNVEVFVYRLPNVFGKLCRPNYNSAIATFCYNVARDMEITVNDPSVIMNVVYIDDVVKEFISAIEGSANKSDDGYCYVPVTYTRSLGEIAGLIKSFRKSRETLNVADMSDGLAMKLYSTYLSYLEDNDFSYPLTMHSDHRGSFTEFIRTQERGQYSVNISKPGIVKGNHWHHTKNEKFLVVSGTGVIRFRKIGTDKVIEYKVSGEKLCVVDIPPGYTHNIENLGDSDMVTIMWANECFDPNNPDTYFEEV